MLTRSTTRRDGTDEDKARQFASFINSGKVKPALRLLSENNSSGVLPLSTKVNEKTVLDALKEKHPSSKPAYEKALMGEVEPSPCFHPVAFSQITGDAIKRAALRTEGAAGPSGIDALAWRRLCTSFGGASSDLCSSIAISARTLCTEFIDTEHLNAYLACRLVPLDKNPGVRPIGICEVLRRIIGRAVLDVLGLTVRESVGTRQLCAGQPAGIEAAIHAMQRTFVDPETEAILLVDASNAFNALNRKVALHNIRISCPALYTILRNTYGTASELFVGGKVIYSMEGTTQGDPLAMPMYAVASVPLIDRLETANSGARQLWFADDSSNAGKLTTLKAWWDLLKEVGPLYGYFPNAMKTWLYVKEEHHNRAEEIFKNDGLTITTEGGKLLGSALGKKEFVSRFVDRKVSQFVREINELARIAVSQPQAAHAAFTHGLVGRWIFFCRTCRELAHPLQPLEDAIRQSLIPVLTGHDCSDQLRGILALPIRLGGLGLVNPMSLAMNEYARSCHVTQPLTEKILEQAKTASEAFAEVRLRRRAARAEKMREISIIAQSLKETVEGDQQRSLELAAEKGASSWLSVLPIARHGFTLHKTAFKDALCLRYGWRPAQLPTTCACGKDFSVDHAMSCPHGGYPSIRHNEVRDLTASLLREVCNDVVVEPQLQPLEGEILHGRTCNRRDDARLDVSMRGFWGERFGRAFVDVRVFCPFAQSNCSSLQGVYKKHEGEKRRAYEQRVEVVELSTFTPLVFATSGGMGKAATVFFRRLASMIADKHHTNYSQTLAWIRARLNFALLRSALLCLRGWRPRHNLKLAIDKDTITSAVTEGRIV